MALTLYVDGDRWRAHLDTVRDTHPRIVPVLKGNGYGFGLARLAEQAVRLGVDTVALGRYDEVAAAREAFGGDLTVLTPWRSFDEPVYDPRVIHTVGRLEDLRELSARADRPRVVLERMTSMRRHGFCADALREAGDALRRTPDGPVDSGGGGGVTVAGVSLHLPISNGSHLTEVERLMTDVVAADLPTRTLFVSHLTDAETEQLRRRWPDYDIRPRIGTSLWLGDRAGLRVRAHVLDVHPVERGEVFGYRSRTAPKAGHILVVSGGTAHGIGLEAPTGGATLKDRAARVAKGGLDAAGFVRSPYTVGGKQRLFAEPPHMQASMLFLPHRAAVPEVGDEVDVRVRFTATSFDRTVIS